MLPAWPGPATAPVSPYPQRFEVKARSRPSVQTHPRHWIAEFKPAIKLLWGDATMLQKRSVSIDELQTVVLRPTSGDHCGPGSVSADFFAACSFEGSPHEEGVWVGWGPALAARCGFEPGTAAPAEHCAWARN